MQIYNLAVTKVIYRPKRGQKEITLPVSFDEDEDFDDTEEDTDSDFEDPDTIEVPKTLSATEKKGAGDGSDDDIEVISSTNNGTKFGSAMGGFRNILPKPAGETGEIQSRSCEKITFQEGLDY